MKLPKLKIGEKTIPVPIIQGGMGVGVSLSNLAGNVAKCGGIGVISSAQIGFKEDDFETNTYEANYRALEKNIKEAKRISQGNGMVAVNIMCVTTNYEEMVKKAAESGADMIISGAGLPKNLPEIVKDCDIKIAPIVSSSRAANLMCKLWTSKYNYVPDMIVVEGPKAGGHLGFKLEELEDKSLNIYDIVKDVVEVVKQYEEKYNRHIPVIAAGGIYDGKDIANALKHGADGVQIATRFVATDECDANIKFKEAYVNAKEDDIVIIKSPVGMPGRAIKNHFLDNLQNYKITKCYNCIKTCDRKTVPYCITKALTNSVEGDIDNGLVFCGSNVDKIDKIVPVKELMIKLEEEAAKYYEEDNE